MQADRILPKLVVEELREDTALQLVNVEQQTRSMVEKAWEREAPMGV